MPKNGTSAPPTYAYDNVNRLTSAVAVPFGTGTWSYNLNFSYIQDGSTGQYGNMVCTTMGTVCGNTLLTVSPATNQIQGYTYGPQGYMTNDTAHTYAYDAEGHVRSIDGGTTLTESYNALGWRVEAINCCGVTDYVRDAAGIMVGSRSCR